MMDREAWCAALHGVAKGRTRLSDRTELTEGIFPTQELNQGLLHCRQILYQLSYQGKPKGGINIYPSFSGG